MQSEEAFRACVSLGRQYGFEEAHSLQDARLALRLFDLLAEALGLPREARDILRCAALLHDIGYAEGYASHHKTAYRLILEASLPALSAREKQIVANVARYHRGARPDSAHLGLATLGAEDRDLVLPLSAILRLADGLDRSHGDAVKGLGIVFEEDHLVVLLSCPQGCQAEVWAGEKKGRFLSEVLGMHVVVRESALADLG